MEKLTGMDWLKKHIGQLEVTNSKFNEKIKNLLEIKPEVYNEFQTWTPLKLVLLNYVLDVCTLIINKTSFFDKKYYIDLFAGSGINKVKNSKNDFLMGSPLIASLKYADKFNKLFFCENNKILSEALDLRLTALNNNKLKFIPQDCNSCLDNLIEEINLSNSYSFFFIDPNGIEFSWESMKKVLNTKSDIMFTLMSSEIMRTVGLFNVKISNGNCLTSFYGNEIWKEIRNADEVAEKYIKNIMDERPDSMIRVIKIKSQKYFFCYHLIFITNKTKKECPWLRAIDKVKGEIELNSDKSVEMALEIVKKRQMTLF